MILCGNVSYAGADTAIVAAGEKTQQWYREVVGIDVETIDGDDDAQFEQVLEIKAEDIPVMVTVPPEIFTNKLAASPKGINVDQCIIGTCLGGSIEDLRTIAAILKGKQIAEDVRMLVSPVTQRTYSLSANEGLLATIADAGATILPPTCDVWGWEPTTIADVKAYKPESKSIGSGQVLQCPYGYDKARLVVREMADQLALDLVNQKLVTDQLVLTVGYDIDNLKGQTAYKGEVTRDRYGRAIPKHAHDTANLDEYTASTKRIVTAALELFDRIIDRNLLVRRFYLTATRIADEASAPDKKAFEQMDFFTDYSALQEQKAQEAAKLEREKKVQKAMLDIKKRFGKNAILKGMNLEEGATAKDRNGMIGGHRSG